MLLPFTFALVAEPVCTRPVLPRVLAPSGTDAAPRFPTARPLTP
ncbi:hypothetical protein ACIRFH_14545 [Streptomyces sp. NPDC093586]